MNSRVDDTLSYVLRDGGSKSVDIGGALLDRVVELLSAGVDGKGAEVVEVGLAESSVEVLDTSVNGGNVSLDGGNISRDDGSAEREDEGRGEELHVEDG